MKNRTVALAGLMLLASPLLAQDASYQETTQLTGGTLVDALKQVAFMKSIKDLFLPQSSLVMVHGNQKAEVSKDRTEITDLDKEAIYRLDNDKKTYTVTTFAQMRQMFAAIPGQMQQAQKQVKDAQAQQAAAPPPDMPANLKMTYEVEARNTGETKVINGQTAQEQIVTMSMHVTDTNSPLAPGTNPATFNMTTDVWISPEPAEMKAVEDFNLRMAQKLMKGVDTKAFVDQFKDMQKQSQASMAPLFAGQPGAAEAMKKMGEEMSKIKGTRIMTTTSMGGIAPAGAPGTASAPPSAPAPTAGSIAGQVATDTATQTAAGEASKMGVFGNALSNSALGAFRKKKATPPPAAPVAAAAPVAPEAGVPAGMQKVVLLSTTQQLTNFSAEPVPMSVFQIPAGFKQVQSPTYPTK